MTPNETQSMIAHKHFLDAYFSLPLSVRAEIEEHMRHSIGLNMAALNNYRAEVRATVNTAVIKANIHPQLNTGNLYDRP